KGFVSMSLSQYILDSREQYRLQVRERNTWLARLRWYYLLILAGVRLITAEATNDDTMRNKHIVLIVGVGLIVNTFLWALTKAKRRPLGYYQIIAVAQITLDVVLAAGIIYLQN